MLSFFFIQAAARLTALPAIFDSGQEEVGRTTCCRALGHRHLVTGDRADPVGQGPARCSLGVAADMRVVVHARVGQGADRSRTVVDGQSVAASTALATISPAWSVAVRVECLLRRRRPAAVAITLLVPLNSSILVPFGSTVTDAGLDRHARVIGVSAGPQGPPDLGPAASIRPCSR